MLISATIEWISPLLQHRFVNYDEIGKTTRKVHITEGSPRDEAERFTYRTANGALFFPGAAIARLLREAGSAHKQRGSRKTLKFIVPSTVLVADEEIVLRDAAGAPLTTFEVDSRPVTIPATKGRVMRHRPRLNSWRATFTLEISDGFIAPATVRQLLEEGGRGIGVGNFRPEKGGPFGRFHVVGWIETVAQAA